MKTSFCTEEKSETPAWRFTCRGTRLEVMTVYLDLRQNYKGVLVSEPDDHLRPDNNIHHQVVAWTTDRSIAIKIKLAYC